MSVRESPAMPPVARPARSSVDEVRDAALSCVTPAQMARLLGLGERQVADLLRDRVGVEVSRGAARHSTYTKRDLGVFDAGVKEKLYAVLLDEFGAEQLAQSAHRVDWFNTATGQGLEALAGLIDVEAGHNSYLRKPISRLDYVVSWFGLIGAAIVTGFSFFILFPVWLTAKHSWDGWRAAKKDRPTGAIVIGWILSPIAAPVVAVYAVPVLLVTGIWRLIKKVVHRRPVSEQVA